MAKQTEMEWLSSGGYLPKFMRDFHVQKNLFKWIFRRAKSAGKPDPTLPGPLAGMTWISAHVFTIDWFLWFMARHGYTLQPSRSRFPTADWDATLQEMHDEDAATFRKMFDERKEDTNHG